MGKRSRGWVRPAVIVLIGMLFAKVVCVVCGLIVGEPRAALQVAVNVWARYEILLNFWEIPPFVLLAGLDVAVRELQPPARRRGTLIGAWLGALAPLLWGYCWVWLGIFGGRFNSTVMLVFVPLPWFAVAGLTVGAGLGCLLGGAFARLSRARPRP